MIQPFCQIGVYGGGSLYDNNPLGVDPNWWSGGDAAGDAAAVAWYVEEIRHVVEDIGWRSVLLHAIAGNVYGSNRYPLMILHPMVVRRLPMLASALYPLIQRGANIGVFLSHWLEPPSALRRPIVADRLREVGKVEEQVAPFRLIGCRWVAIDAVSGEPDVRDAFERRWRDFHAGDAVLGEAVPVLPTGAVYRQDWDVMLPGSEWTGDVTTFYDGIVDPGRTWRGVGPDRQQLGATFYVQDAPTTADVDGWLARGFAVNCNTGVSDAIQRYCVEQQR